LKRRTATAKGQGGPRFENRASVTVVRMKGTRLGGSGGHPSPRTFLAQKGEDGMRSKLKKKLKNERVGKREHELLELLGGSLGGTIPPTF